MYKPILAIEKKNNNMKLCLLFIPIVFLLFLMGNVNAYLVNFTGSTPKYLVSIDKSYEIKARYFNNSFFVSYMKEELPDFHDFYISKWNNDFSIKQIDWTGIIDDPDNIGQNDRYVDFVLNLENSNYPLNRFIYATSGRTWFKSGNFSQSLDEGFGSNENLAPDVLKGITLSNNRYVLYKDSSLYWDDVINSWNDGGFTYSGTLTLPSYVTSITGYNTVKLVYVPINNEYWLFYPDQDSIIRVSRYDSSMNYINTYQITGSGEIPSNDYNPITISPTAQPTYPDYDVVYSEKYGYIVYMVTHLYGNNTIEFNAFDVISTKQIDSLVLVDDQKIDLTQYDNLLTSINVTQAISFAYNPDKAHFYLFYAYNYSASSLSLNVLEESVLCQCSAWVDQSECIGNQYRKQTRTCVPSYCTNDTIQYVLDSSCQYVPPPNITNATKFYQNVSACEIHTSELGKSQKCEFNLNVPSQCQLNTVVVTLSGTILSENNQKCNQGSWNISLCNPSFSCNNYGHTCNEFNWTHEYTRYTYQHDDQALLQVIGIVPTSCGSWYCGFDRVQAWILSADLKVECQIACYNKTVCGSGNTFGYSCFERSDCYQESCTFCPLGCRENTGLCAIAGEPSVTPSGVAPQPSNYANPFKFFKDTTEFAFADSTWMLNLISIFITGGSAVFVGIKAKNWIIALIVAMGVALFFLTMGWLPAWIGIVWVLSIALVLTNMFREKIVGK